MKFSYFIAVIVCAALLSVVISPPQPVQADGPKIIEVEKAPLANYDLDEDTLSTSSSTDQVIFDLGYAYGPTAYALQVNADSISGATGATCVLQVATDMGNTDYADLESVTINGVSTREIETGTAMRGRLRCKCDAPSSTQVTTLRIDFSTFGAVFYSNY